MEDADMSEDPKAFRATAEKDAADMTKRFMGMDFGGYNTGGREEGAVRQPTEQNIETLLAEAEDNPALIAKFNSHFGEGAAERILNEQR
jgi:hypothetical protein